MEISQHNVKKVVIMNQINDLTSYGIISIRVITQKGEEMEVNLFCESDVKIEVVNVNNRNDYLCNDNCRGKK